ncbi:MAG: hypothetical protein GTO40_20135, partial [Deltaproteobacteria bacterium]|nr:hypothetical protein [Deltaproteobacteria bacterium]
VTYTDGFINNVEDFDEVLKYPTRLIANLNAGISGIDDTWYVGFWVRNLFDEGIQYFPEFDFRDDRGRVDWSVSPRNWTSYGMQLRYNYN